MRRSVPEFEDINTQEFLAELQGKSVQSFAQLAKVVFAPLWRFLTVCEGVPEADAEEIAQDTLLKVYHHVGKFRRNGQAKLTTWIFQIGRNLAMDYHRVSRPECCEFIEEEFSASADRPFARRNAAYLSRLRAALEMLSAQDQQVLMWRARDIVYAEIAGWLGVKECAARVRYFRAEKRLMAVLESLGPVGETVLQSVEETVTA